MAQEGLSTCRTSMSEFMYLLLHVCLSIRLSLSLSLRLSVSVYLCLPIYLPACLSVCKSVSLYVCMSVCLYVSMSLCLYASKCARIYVCVCVQRVCVCLCICVRCVCIHVHDSYLHTRLYACFVHMCAQCMLACLDHGSHQHQSARLFNKLQAAEHAAGIEGDSEGADNFQTGEGLNAPAVQAWKSPQQILYQKVQHDADASASHDGVDDGLEASAGAQPEAFIDIMDKQPYYQMSAPMSDEQYFGTPPFSAKGRRLPQLVVRRQMALHAQHAGLISKESDAQHAEHEEQEFMREAHSFLGQQNTPVEGAPQDQEQASFVAEAHQFLKGGAAAGISHEEEASPWEWVREEHAAEEEQESDEEQKAFARDAQVWLANGQDKAFAMPAPSHLFFDDEGITRKDWVDEQSHASEEQEGGPGAFAGKALLLGEA